jgi:NNP family nitrate/nitrite transporter-like MFS transporter
MSGTRSGHGALLPFPRMSTTVAAPTTARATRRHWIDHWEPENEQFWESTGRRVARRNLVLSIFAEHLGFSIWVLWTIVVINLANVGIAMSVPEQFWLTAVPNLVGSALRIPYTFAVPRFGGRAWTCVSASLLLIPSLLLAIVVPSGWLADQGHDTQFLVLMACAATAGFGGGNFSSSMANISFFYPERRKGFALGLNAAGGNLGVAVAQLLVPLVIIVGVPAAAVKLPEHQVHLSYAGLMWLPFITLAVLGAWLYMDSLTQAKTDTSAYRAAVRQSQTWVMAILYIGTFGSFIGYSFALPLVIKNTFPEFLGQHPFIATYLVGMGAATVAAIVGVQQHSFALFFASYMVIFLLAGMGNGSTYRMIPSIFAALGRRDAETNGRDLKQTLLSHKRQAAAVIGIVGAVGAFGGFLIQVVLRQASLGVAALVKAAETPAQKAAIAQAHADWSVPALWVFVGAYVLFAGMTWFFYLRRSVGVRKIPSFAYASV